MKQKTKETTIKVGRITGKIILGTITTTGLISMAILAPNAVQALDMFTGRKKYYRSSYVKKAIYKLEERGFIEFKEQKEGIFVRLTDKGRRDLLKYQMRDKMIKKPRKWDKKWRVVIFDIKEQDRNLREGLRKELINLGFIKLQNSVWVYPYECEEIIIMLKSYFRLGKDVLYMTVEKIENDKWLKDDFDLE